MIYWIYKDSKDDWRWFLKTIDGEPIAESGKGYKAKYDCERGLNLARGSANAPVYTQPESIEGSSISPTSEPADKT
jgi:uncharacterized protein YegP (UPF0339 family)